MEANTKNRKRNLIFGLIAGLLFMVGDLLWEFHGQGVTESLNGMFIDTSWTDFSEWRFSASIIVAAISMPFYYLGFMEFAQMILEHAKNDFDRKLAKWFKRAIVFAAIFFLFIHASLVIMGTIYKEVLAVTGDAQASAQVCNHVLIAQALPLIAGYLLSDGIYVVVMILLAFRKTLPVHPVLVFISNPLMIPLIANVLSFCPWPINQLDPATESMGHAMMMVVALLVYRADQKQKVA